MAKDYFQDITPPDDAGAPDVGLPHNDPPAPPLSDKSIRNVNIPQRPRPMGDMRPPMPPRPPSAFPPPPRRRSRAWLWVLCIVCVLVLAFFILLFFFRTTTVSVVPQSQPVTFDPTTSQFTAYPSATAASGTIPYTVESTTLDGSQVVSSNGTQEVDTKANGSVIVVNDYSASPVKLIANTRFETSGGLIFRVPAAVVIPGKQGSTAGKVTVTIAADQTGAQYNIGPQSKLTIPGLQSSGAEYTEVYAYSTASTTGGASGEQPAVAPSDLSSAQSQVRAQLQTQATAYAASLNSGTQIALTPRVTFTDEPETPEAGNTVRIHESAQVDVPVVPSNALASAVAQTVAADTSLGSVMLVPAQAFAISIPDTSGTWGTDPIDFTLSGGAQLVWTVDTGALAQALAGKNQSAFQTIVSNFPGVQSAHARIEPFWDSTFPSNPADIHITVSTPATAQ